jgi:hypothetical protein
MILGIISDTHDKLKRTKVAIQLLLDAGAEAIVHCGDLNTPPILEVCAVKPCWFVFGNNDDDSIPELRKAAKDLGAVCLEWGGVFELGGKRIGVTHGHMTSDVHKLFKQAPDYLLTGHSHIPGQEKHGRITRINPGALHRAEEHTVATLDLATGAVKWLRVEK